MYLKREVSNILEHLIYNIASQENSVQNSRTFTILYYNLSLENGVQDSRIFTKL